MTSVPSTHTGRRRVVIGAVASGALVVGMLAGAPQALSDPGSPITPGGADSPVTPGGTGGAGPAAGAPGEITADQALAIIASDYDTGAGGGKLSTLIHNVMTLRARGFYPSVGNREDIVAALDKRPNQAPLVAALQSTLSYQLRAQQRAAAQKAPAPSMGINQLPNGSGQNPIINLGTPG